MGVLQCISRTSFGSGGCACCAAGRRLLCECGLLLRRDAMPGQMGDVDIYTHV